VIKSGSVLVINCGSSSIKFSVINHEASTRVIRGSIERIGQENAQLKYMAAHGMMGLTPIEGLVMGTRNGDIDRGLHAHLKNNWVGPWTTLPTF
jgi:acetate kinase